MRIAITSTILLLYFSSNLAAQNQMTGRIVGTVSDQTGAMVDGAEVRAVDIQTGVKRLATTNAEGNYAFPFLSPGTYRVEFRADGFSPVLLDDVRVFITETATFNVRLRLAAVAGDTVNVLAEASPPNGPQLGRVVDSETVSELPQATRNITQILALSPGTSVGLADNTALGRNSQNISVNGARVTQNDFQINGIDANRIDTNSAFTVAVPAPETIQEFKVQTSVYDAAFGRGAGGSVQTITRSGGNAFHGALYDYFRNEALNANDPFLKAARVARPILRRNVLGVLAGGPARRDKSFFFVSYQATRDRNGASGNSSSDVPVAQGLTDDRSEQTLLTTFNTPSINPVSLALLNAKLPNGKFLIPTPQADGRYVGVDVSTYREDQFNINADHQLGPADRLSVKFFYSNAPQFMAMPDGGANVPGFGADRKQDNRLLSIQYVRAFSSHTVNEARAGYSVIRKDTFGRQPVRDADFGISRANAAAYPGLGLILIGPAPAGLAIGNAGTSVDAKNDALAVTLADTISISRGKHDIRTGAGTVFYRDNLTTNNNRRGQIQFPNFDNFLVGKANRSTIGDGINWRRMRFADYSFFLQDDWTVSSRLTFNLGLRYELNLPPLEKDGAIATFDPNLYKPSTLVDARGVPIGPPAEGFVQAGNVIPSLDSSSIPNVGNRVFKSIDPNNIAPRVGFAYVPPLSTRLLVRGGYGIFYSRLSTAHIGLTISQPPFYAVSQTPPGGTVPSFADPYYPLPSQDQFPILVKGVSLTGQMFDRGIRTPYFHQYNFSVQWKFTEHLQFEAAYAGSRGLDLLRGVPINYARLASSEQPITNAVTGQVITTNSPDSKNVALRTPYQGVAQLVQIQSSGQSSYNSMQVSLAHRKFKGLQFLASYTYSKSMDNGSGGSASTGEVFETEPARGANPLDPRSNRGLSNFDRTHRFVTSYIWKLPGFADPRLPALRKVLSNWQLAGIVPVMSGLPIEILDGTTNDVASFYGSSTWRPNWAPGADRRTAVTNIPPGYFFNPFAFTRPIVQANQPIPSSGGLAIANAVGTDFGDVGRNVLRGPAQINVDLALTRRFPVAESSRAEFRVEFFNLFNHVNLANPISTVNAATAFSNTGVILAPGDFGRILSTSSNLRLIQLALKLNW
jgi:hypothetical protein